MGARDTIRGTPNKRITGTSPPPLLIEVWTGNLIKQIWGGYD